MPVLSRVDPEHLRVVPLFRLMSDEALRRIAGLVCRLHVPAGAVASDGVDHALHIVVAGAAEVRRGGIDGPVVTTLGEGQCCGDRSLLHDDDERMALIACTDLVVDQIRVEDLRKLVDDAG